MRFLKASYPVQFFVPFWTALHGVDRENYDRQFFGWSGNVRSGNVVSSFENPTAAINLAKS
ncbi:MAG: hypothetical protein H0W43_02975 [Chthoniobacterales bacterium]|nr:hypothetical protein [Chthoniobacterales bacterium]